MFHLESCTPKRGVQYDQLDNLKWGTLEEERFVSFKGFSGELSHPLRYRSRLTKL